MKKFYLIVLLLLFLTNCSAPGSALLGPAFTGATTKSVAQASLSFGTNQIVRQIHNASKKSKKKVRKIVEKIDDFQTKSFHKDTFLFHR